MKKVFAVMSTLLLTIAFFGLLSTKVNASGALFTDPYEAGALAEDEDPIYIMDSIYSTFPKFYDNAAQPDGLWAGAARMYPWNETKLRVAQLDENGQATGRYYAIFFSGALNADDAGAGNNAMILDAEVADDGTVTAVSKRTSIYDTEDGVADGMILADHPQDQSLSHMAVNISDYDLEFEPLKLYSSSSTSQGYASQIMNRSIIFDGQGRAIRGVGVNEFYVADTDATYLGYGFAPEFCYVDGVVTRYAEGVVCDKAKEQAKDENGVLMTDENGEPIMVEVDKPAFLYERFVWEWFAEKPENVNEVPYLSAEWDPTKWDYCFEKDGGYMCIAFNGSAGTLDNMTAAQKAAYIDAHLPAYLEENLAQYIADNYEAELAAYVEANKLTKQEDGSYTNEEGKAVSADEVKAAVEGVLTDKLTKAFSNEVSAIKRTCISFVRVPAGGVVYDFGYLDNGKPVATPAFFNMLYNGYHYGRLEGMAEVKTVNFSAKPIYTVDSAQSGEPLRVKEGTNTVEVKNGTHIDTSWMFKFDGLAKMYLVDDDITSYSSDTSVLDVTITLNGVTVVSPIKWDYNDVTPQEMMRDFFDDLRHFYIGDLELGGKTLAYSGGNSYFLDTDDDGEKDTDFTTDLDTFIDKWTSKIVDSWGLFNGGDSTTGSGFLNQPEVRAKWSPFTAYMNDLMGGTFWSSAYTSYARIRDYYQAKDTSFPNAANGASVTKTPQVIASTKYEFDVTGKTNDRYTLTVDVKNTVSGVQDSMTMVFVIVEEYTPIVVVNEDALYVYPEEVDGKVVINPIDRYSLFTAYDGAYCATTGDLRGTVVTELASVTSETLDFDNPVEGEHLVKVVVKSVNATREVVEYITVNVLDITAPTLVVAPTMGLAYGAKFHVLDAVVLAADNVDGNLFDSKGIWWADKSSNKVDTTKPGTYNVTIAVYDASGNETEAKFKVVVYEQGLSEESFNELIDEKLAELEDLGLQLDEINSLLTAKGCKSKKLFFVEFLAAAGLLALILRKKH